MAVRPRDVYYPSENDQEEIKKLEAQIDAQLKGQGRYRGGCITLSPDSFGKDIVIREALFKLYRNAGWKVTHHSDQRDGDYISFEAPDRDSRHHDDDDSGPCYGR